MLGSSLSRSPVLIFDRCPVRKSIIFILRNVCGRINARLPVQFKHSLGLVKLGPPERQLVSVHTFLNAKLWKLNVKGGLVHLQNNTRAQDLASFPTHVINSLAEQKMDGLLLCGPGTVFFEVAVVAGDLH